MGRSSSAAASPGWRWRRSFAGRPPSARRRGADRRSRWRWQRCSRLFGWPAVAVGARLASLSALESRGLHRPVASTCRRSSPTCRTSRTRTCTLVVGVLAADGARLSRARAPHVCGSTTGSLVHARLGRRARRREHSSASPRVRVEPLPAAKPGAFDYGRYLRRRGEHVLLEGRFADAASSRGGAAACRASSTACATPRALTCAPGCPAAGERGAPGHGARRRRGRRPAVHRATSAAAACCTSSRCRARTSSCSAPCGRSRSRCSPCPGWRAPCCSCRVVVTYVVLTGASPVDRARRRLGRDRPAGDARLAARRTAGCCGWRRPRGCSRSTPTTSST